MMTLSPIDATAIALENVVHDRIHELWSRRAWYRSHLGWIPEQQVEDRAELRYLVGLARKARALAAPATRDYPATATYHEPELVMRYQWGDR